MSVGRDEDFLTAIAGVAKLGGFTLKGVSTADDFATRTVTVKFTRISDGHVQEAFEWERESAQVAAINGRGKVESVVGDLAETEAEAEREIAAAALATDPDESGAEGLEDDPSARTVEEVLPETAMARRR